MTGFKNIALAGLACASVAGTPNEAAAKIVRLEITKVEPAFDGRSFGTVGTYEKLTGKAYGVLNPTSRSNRIIQDIALAPRNAKGQVE
jgi:hypothetical protein